MPQPLLELGGAPDAPILHIAPANGFVPQTYLPLLHPLLPQYRVVCLPPRALWGETRTPPPAPHEDWTVLAEDLLAGLRAQGWRDVIAVGHSFGGIASMIAVLRQPELFKALILLDPTILPPHVITMILEARRQNIPIPLAAGALRRRRTFASIEDAFANFRGKALFEQWSDETLRLYAEYGTQPTPEGERLLTWSPEWEAHYFTVGYAHAWEMVTRLDGLLPVLFVQGGNSDTYTTETFHKIEQLVPRATHITLPGHGHLFPQSAPQAAGDLLRAWLAGLA